MSRLTKGVVFLFFYIYIASSVSKSANNGETLAVKSNLSVFMVSHESLYLEKVDHGELQSCPTGQAWKLLSLQVGPSWTKLALESHQTNENKSIFVVLLLAIASYLACGPEGGISLFI